MSQPDHLIIVCCHAIWQGGPSHGADEYEWVIDDWKKGESATFMEHIKAGVEALSKDKRAMLVFSGGPTSERTPLSEGRSYANVAAANEYFGYLPAQTAGHHPSISEGVTAAVELSHPRVLVEDRAMDSYQNILYSIILFWRHTGHKAWPSRLTVVSHAFKRMRLVNEHCRTLGYSSDKVDFIGIDPPRVALFAPSERKAVELWHADTYGTSEVLKGKRVARNTHQTSQTIFQDDQERSQSGLQTRFLDDGEEVLVEGTTLPWHTP